MPRNGSGTSSVINTFVIDTIADPDEVNANFDDVADQLTNSLPRDGQAGMNAPLPLQNGTNSAPALTFTSDTDTGLYRVGANKMGVALGGVALPFDAGVLYAAKSANYTAVASDNNAAHRYTATATISLTAAATLGANWHYTIIADGADVTIDPNGAETIDGSATVIIPNGYSALITCDGTAFYTNKLWSTVKSLTTTVSAIAMPGHLFGLTLSNNGSDATNDIDIAIGSAASDATSPTMMTLASGLTKRLDANWAVGTNQGGLDTGSVGNNVYYIWLIQRSNTGVVDALFSLSSTAPTMPSNYDRKRLIGSFARVGAVNQAPRNNSVETTPWVAYTPTFTGFGTVTAISIFSRRVGDTLQIRGYFTTGTPTATEARMSLGFNGVDSKVVSDTTKVAAIQQAGSVLPSIGASGTYYSLIESAVGYLTFSFYNSSNAGLTKVNGSGIFSATTKYTVTAEIPISGW